GPLRAPAPAPPLRVRDDPARPAALAEVDAHDVERPQGAPLEAGEGVEGAGRDPHLEPPVEVDAHARIEDETDVEVVVGAWVVEVDAVAQLRPRLPPDGEVR